MTRVRWPRVRRIQTVVGTFALAGVVFVNGPPVERAVTNLRHEWLVNSASYKREHGHWSLLSVPKRFRINAVHAALLHTGKVLIIAGSGNDAGAFRAGTFKSLLWDPATGAFKEIPTPSDMFCGGHAFLPDGKLLIAGGTTRYEVLREQVRVAAGVMTITNSDAHDSTILPKGTLFLSTDGHGYRSIADTSIPAAHGRVPSETRLWVTATKAGRSEVSDVETRYDVGGLVGAETHTIEAKANSLTLNDQTFWGSRQSYVFDPETERYTRVSNMHLARWYPTLVRLADGKVLAVSGLDQFGQIIAGNNEIWDPKTHRWSVSKRLTKAFPTYPALFLTSSGNLFFTGGKTGYGPDTPAWRTSGVWNVRTNGFQVVPGMRDPRRTVTSASVLLPPAQNQRYAILGGGEPGEDGSATARIDVADLRRRHPHWQPAAELPTPTRYPEVVLTPDDNVIVSGGSRGYRGASGSDLFVCLLFDPRHNSLRRLAKPLVGRDYHAEALLLPDGRILTLGGNPLFGNETNTAPGYFEQRIAIFTPPYLYRGGRRPRIVAGPQELERGQTASFLTPDAASIRSARLMRPSAVTHVTDVEQRSIALGLQRRGGAIAITVPEGAGLVPPGWYMLFVNDARGVPSVARWVHVT